jgi:hypothetical protein
MGDQVMTTKPGPTKAERDMATTQRSLDDWRAMREARPAPVTCPCGEPGKRTGDPVFPVACALHFPRLAS